MADYNLAPPLPEAAALLTRLAGLYAKVAVISGRPLAYLGRHLAGASGVELVGLYGLERATVGAPGSEVPGQAANWREAVEAAAEAAEAEVPRGVVVERKGLAVTIHYRAAPEHRDWAESFAARQAMARGLVAHPGKRSVELRPAVSTDKGTVVAELASGRRAVCFVGDDRGDLPAFAELARIRASHPDVATLSVAVAGAETPAEVLAAADYVVDGPAGVMQLLAALAGPHL